MSELDAEHRAFESLMLLTKLMIAEHRAPPDVARLALATWRALARLEEADRRRGVRAD